MKATTLERTEAFDREGWVFELKHDGFRSLAYVHDGACELVSRNDDLFKRFEPLAKALSRELGEREVVLDGEVVCLDEHGRAQFYELIGGPPCPTCTRSTCCGSTARTCGRFPYWRERHGSRR